MKIKELFLLLIILISLEIRAQESYYMPNTDDIESIVTYKNHSIGRYLAKNIRYSIDAQKKGICGTYIGCIRINQKGNLIDVFTINSLTSSLDNQFVSLIKNAWRSKEIEIEFQNDTTDIIVPISYKFSRGVGQEPFYFYVDKELAPKNIFDEIVVIASPIDYSIPQLKKDTQLLNKANEMYKTTKYRQCVRSLNELIRRNPYNADLLYMRAKAYIFLKKEDKALRDYLYIKKFLNNEKYRSLESCLKITVPNKPQ